MNQHGRKKQQSEVFRNRILLLLLIATAVLVAVIVFTTAKKGKPTDEATSSAPPSSQAPSAPESTSQPDSSSPTPSSQTSGTPASSSKPSSSSAPAVSSTAADSSSAASSDASPSGSSAAEGQDKYYEEALPMLVNPTNKIPEGYTPELAEIGNGYKLQSRAASAFADMMKQAQQDGVSLWVVSAYRSHDKQTTNFNNKIKEYENLGYTAEQAYAATARLIAVPGTSEHSLGYAVDLNSLETTFESTKQFTWLQKNCAKYGFVLRYPKDKVEITDISYEPWHYRYVGSNHAAVIMEKSICLEEYLSGDY